MRKKLIEVALPLDAINAASAREKSIRHGHPSTLHLWWARRPLAAARAVIFAQMVDDPSVYTDALLAHPPTKLAAEREWKKRLAAFLANRAEAGDEAAGGDRPTHPPPTLEDVAADLERQRLFGLIEELVKWGNTTNEELLRAARDEIRASWRRTCEENADHPRAGDLFDPDRLPAFHDPFAGGGALPLEAQRLGLEAHASDLNPVAVLINKAMIEIPPRFAGRPPVNPEARPDAPVAEGSLIEREWKGAQGLAEDVRYYGRWMRDEAEKRIGHLYPKIEVTAEMARGRPDLERYAGRKLTVIAWLWARTVKSPNPAFRDVDVPLATTFMLSTKKGKEAWVEPVIEAGGYRFTVKVGTPSSSFPRKRESMRPGNAGVPPAQASSPTSVIPAQAGIHPSRGGVSRQDTGVPPAQGTSAGKRRAFRCLMSGVPVTYEYIRSEGKAGRMGARLMAIVAEGDRGRVYLAPSGEQEEIAEQEKPTWKPDCELPKKHRDFKGPVYGLDNVGDLFTPRQLVALTTFSDLVQEAIARVRQDVLGTRASRPHGGEAPGNESAGGTPAFPGDDLPLRDGGTGSVAYAEAIGVYSALTLSRFADRNNALCTWDTGPTGTRASTGGSARTASLRNLFSRQAIPMAWDYGEANPFSDSGGGYSSALGWVEPAIRSLIGLTPGIAKADNAPSQTIGQGKVVSTDPLYYDNVCYADLSDFFYVWLRRSLRSTFPELFATLAVPKAEELVATPYRHSSKDEAETFFLDGMTRAMQRLAEQTHPGFPVTIYYAFKQSERKGDGDSGVTRTGWETFLDAVIRSGFAVTGTWPMRTELGNRMIGMGANALASSIVLVCRKRPADAALATRRQFVTALKAELPAALARLQSGNIAPVDLAQAAIGPGMAVYTRYARVLDASGQPVSVREALALINQTLDETLAEQEGDFDADSRWALAWFEQHGFEAGEYGAAETLSKAKNTSVGGLVQAGVLASKAGKVRLLKPEELPADWNPATDPRLTVWETVHQLVRALETGGETAAARLVRRLGGVAGTARELAYRLYAVSERRSRAAEALSYNALVRSWPEVARLAQRPEPSEPSKLL